MLQNSWPTDTETLAAGWLSLLLEDNIWNHGEFDKITVAHCDSVKLTMNPNIHTISTKIE
jgi:hypothetical protein